MYKNTTHTKIKFYIIIRKLFISWHEYYKLSLMRRAGGSGNPKVSVYIAMFSDILVIQAVAGPHSAMQDHSGSLLIFFVIFFLRDERKVLFSKEHHSNNFYPRKFKRISFESSFARLSTSFLQFLKNVFSQNSGF